MYTLQLKTLIVKDTKMYTLQLKTQNVNSIQVYTLQLKTFKIVLNLQVKMKTEALL